MAIRQGASEIDTVIQIGWLKEKNYRGVAQDITAVVESAGDALVKVIIETCLLTDEEKRVACAIAVSAGARFVKTSTGFSKTGATEDDVRLMREVVGALIGVKAAGGIRDLHTAIAMLNAGRPVSGFLRLPPFLRRHSSSTQWSITGRSPPFSMLRG